MAFYDFNLARKLGPTALKFAMLGQQRAFNIVRKYLPSFRENNISVLEIGVGKGFFADICLSEGLRYQGMEPNVHTTSKLSQKGVSIVRSVAPPIPFASEKFDLVYSSHVIEHLMNHKEAFEFIQEMYRVAKPQGIIVILCPDFIKVGKEFWNMDYTHTYVTTRGRIKQIFKDCGINTIETVFHSGHIFGKRSSLVSILLRLYPYKLLQNIFSHWVDPDIFYRPRRALAEGILIIGRKECI